MCGTAFMVNNPVFFPSSIYCKSDVTGEKLNANLRLWALKEEVLHTNISKVYTFSLNVIKSAIKYEKKKSHFAHTIHGIITIVQVKHLASISKPLRIGKCLPQRYFSHSYQ